MSVCKAQDCHRCSFSEKGEKIAKACEIYFC